ncbi:hypothetical protein [Bradyrhizobium sp. STM 3562]|uniref:hypothetical protein n=1 Tax=Bradyrhizobium sp. STM 3562 TaxID=578924 RepID=UPI00388E4D93
MKIVRDTNPANQTALDTSVSEAFFLAVGTSNPLAGHCTGIDEDNEKIALAFHLGKLAGHRSGERDGKPRYRPAIISAP